VLQAVGIVAVGVECFVVGERDDVDLDVTVFAAEAALELAAVPGQQREDERLVALERGDAFGRDAHDLHEKEHVQA
jgi:hypothetical protein